VHPEFPFSSSPRPPGAHAAAACLNTSSGISRQITWLKGFHVSLPEQSERAAPRICLDRVLLLSLRSCHMCERLSNCSAGSTCPAVARANVHLNITSLQPALMLQYAFIASSLPITPKLALPKQTLSRTPFAKRDPVAPEGGRRS
jgi:hypothetical protein